MTRDEAIRRARELLPAATKARAAMVTEDHGGGASTLLFRKARAAREAADVLTAAPDLLAALVEMET